MINSNKLKARIIELNIAKKKIADELGISLTSLNYKLNGKTQFTASEIYILCDILGIQSEKDAYFFVSSVG